MTDKKGFTDFMRRIRAGDESAASELVQRFEPLIRREVRARLEDTRLSRSLDSIDVSQSVLASFFVRVAAGEYDLDEPEQLIRLLMKMARNKLVSKARRQFSEKREARRIDLGDDQLELVPDHADSPSQNASGREMFQRFYARLTDEERQICDMRSRELSWDQVAGQLGGAPSARRMQLTRAIDRVSQELGLDQ